MKMKLIVVLLSTLVVGFTGCSSKSNPVRKPVTNIQITPSNKMVTYGNEFTINLTSRITKPEVISIDLYFDNKLIQSSDKEAFSVSINSKNYLPGQHTIRTVAKNNKDKIGNNYIIISIVSDIEPKKLSYRIIETLPHNTKNYTEGFEFYKGTLYESTGNYAESFIYAYHPESQKIISSLKIDDQYFGEGITILNDKLYQLTYKAQKGFIYDVKTFKKIGEFSFPSKEGWGLTNDGKSLIMSNGTSSVSYINPTSFQVEKTIDVNYPKGLLKNINELEYVNGNIYANIWTTQTIVKFDAETGRVLAFIDMKGLLSNLSKGKIDVLNGIAYNANEDLFYVTGKWWTKMFKVKFE